MKKVAIVTVAVLALGLAACNKNDAGNTADAALNAAGNAVENAGEAVENASDAVANATTN